MISIVDDSVNILDIETAHAVRVKKYKKKKPQLVFTPKLESSSVVRISS